MDLGISLQNRSGQAAGEMSNAIHFPTRSHQYVG